MQQGVGGSGALQQSSNTLNVAMLMPRAACSVLSILFGSLLNNQFEFNIDCLKG